MTHEQLTLTNQPHRRHGQRAPDQPTSLAAQPKTGSLEARVYEYLVGLGLWGATDAELIEHFDTQSARPRRIALERRGKVGDSGRRRKTRRGKQAIVWVVRHTLEEGT